MSQEPVEASRNEELPSLKTDTLFSILSRERRRYALYCLQQYRNPMTLADLADEVARLEHDERSVAQIPAEDIRSIYLNLYHSHVPKMADADVVEYDQADDTVRLKYEFATLDLEDYI